MSTRTLVFSWVCMALAVPALAQTGEDVNTPPTITAVDWTIIRNLSGDVIGTYGASESFDPAVENAAELDIITVTVTVFDPDFVTTADDSEGDAVFLLFQSTWSPVPGYPSPEPPPIAEDQTRFFPEDEGLSPPPGSDTVTVIFTFQVPEFFGRNQARLRGFIDYDVAWLFHVMVSNEQDPGCTQYADGFVDRPCDNAVDVWYEFFYAIENPFLSPPNPPPFANAGRDQTVAAGDVVTLDGSRTYDAFNIGFDTDSTSVIQKDILTYTWEWISGPARVDPIQSDETDPFANVTLDVAGEYVFRLTVDDNVNSLPSADSVVITVLDELPPSTAPRAVITGPANPVPVGSVVTLCGRNSCDPDWDSTCGEPSQPDYCADTDSYPSQGHLTFRWQQTNEVYQPLTLDEVSDSFQPLAGMTAETSTWQALAAGTYYFRLLVDDDDFRSSATFSVEVFEPETSGETATADAASSGGTGSDSAQTTPAAPMCGAGMLPVAAVPFALWLTRRRHG